MERAYVRVHAKGGFALAEVLVALFFVTLAVVLVGGLAQQVANFTKSSNQAAALMEMRSRVGTINRDVVDWMDAMRSSSAVSVNFSNCLPDSGIVSSTFSCPANDPNVFAADAELQRLAGPQFATVVSTTIVDKRGQAIAGEMGNPLYLESDGSPCTRNPQTDCPLMSTGYFLRTNSATNANPGDVKFYVKVERNIASPFSRGLAAMKPQYTSVEVGTEWLGSSKNCASGMKLGYLTSNEAYCVNTMSSCPVGQITMGVDASGSGICVTPPTCDATKFAVLSTTGNLECMDSSPCPSGTVSLGFFGGSGGKKICSSPNVKCSAGQVQVGTDVNPTTGALEPVCEVVPTCTKNQAVSYTGTEFVCTTAVAEVGCSPGEVLVGITKAGAPLCETKIAGADGTDGTAGKDGTTTPLAGLDCGEGNYLQGVDANGVKICRPITPPPPGESDGMGFVGQNQLPAFTQSLASNDYDRQKHIWPISCHVTAGSKTYQCGYFANRFTISGTAFNVATEDKNYESIGSSTNNLNSRRCMFVNGTWKMYSGSNRYNRICTGGVMYKKMEPAASRLDMRSLGHPEFAAEATLSRQFVNSGTMGAGAGKAPSAAQLMLHFNSCDVVTGTLGGVADTHCMNLKNALDKAKRYTSLNEGAQNYPSLTPQFCQAYNGDFYYWAGCGSACGVVLKVDYKAGLTPFTHGYRFFYRWARNYLPPTAGSNFPTGTLCTGGSSTAGTNRVRVAPAGMAETDGNDSDETGVPEEEVATPE